jgi:hypothetical protein
MGINTADGTLQYEYIVDGTFQYGHKTVYSDLEPIDNMNFSLKKLKFDSYCTLTNSEFCLYTIRSKNIKRSWKERETSSSYDATKLI